VVAIATHLLLEFDFDPPGPQIFPTNTSIGLLRCTLKYDNVFYMRVDIRGYLLRPMKDLVI
jgi:hypothetical protein